MKKSAAAVAAAVALLAFAGFAGGAVAGGPNGDSHQGQGQSQSQGQKPDNTTMHDTSCSTGGGQGNSATCTSTTSSKSDASKLYGNGKTAAQIANGKGAPSGTSIYGPGNSQPHKICGRDVHAYKGGDCSKGSEGKKSSHHEEQGQAHVKVYICHATGSTTNPYVLIHVSVNAEWAHTHHQDGRDIVLGASAGPCPAGSHSHRTTTATTTTTTPVTTTSTVAATTTATVATTTTVAATTTVATTTTTAAAGAPSAPTPPASPAPTGGVQGASKSVVTPTASSAKPSSGVLGTAKTLGSAATSGTLPFTGLRLWIVELIALGLIGTGVAMRLVARRQGS